MMDLHASFCQRDNDSVRDSRTVDDGRCIRRRRFCNHCKRRFTTFERVERSLLVIKKGGEREPFARAKIEYGLERACWKREVTAERIRSPKRSKNEIAEEYELEVPTLRDIGELVMKHLASVDQVAFVRFASVYRVNSKMFATSSTNFRPMLRKPGEGNGSRCRLPVPWKFQPSASIKVCFNQGFINQGFLHPDRAMKTVLFGRRCFL
ncbi:MAG: ATP cone domain-containing protein [Pirellulales bacterium]